MASTLAAVEAVTRYPPGLSADIAADGLKVKSNLALGGSEGFLFYGSANNVTGNVASGNLGGFDFQPPASNNTVSDNSVAGNLYYGIYISAVSGATVSRTNLFGNGTADGGYGLNCGLVNQSGDAISAQEVFWGNSASPGPGADPADGVCNFGAGSTTDASMPSAVPFK